MTTKLKILVTHAMVVNPKEYLEIFMDRFLNEKQKGIKKGSSGLGFENFSQIIKSLVNFDAFKSLPVDTKKVLRLTATSGEMVKKTVTKSKLSQLNNERFFFNDGVVSLPFDHPD